MNAEVWLAALAPQPEALRQLDKLPLWRRNFAALPETVAALQPEFYRPLVARSRHAPALMEKVDAAAAKFRSDPVLNGLFALTRDLYYGLQTQIPEVLATVNRWLEERLSVEETGLFRLLLTLSAYPLWSATYARLGVPQSYADAVLAYVDGAIGEFAAGHPGLLGVNLSKPGWARHYVEGRLFRIGRFEWMIEPPHPWLPALFRSRKTGKIAALCQDGWHLRPDGFCQWRDEDPADGIVTRLTAASGKITGTPVDPHGFALPGRTLTLDLAEYAPLYQAYDVIPMMHIPGGGGMTPEACRESLTQVAPFFKRYFGYEIPLVCCVSWILNPDFERELPESNLAKLMRSGFRFPFGPCWGIEGLIFVFGKDNLAEFPGYAADNSLRRAFHRIHDQGGRFRSGGMFLLVEDLARYGEHPAYAGRCVC